MNGQDKIVQSSTLGKIPRYLLVFANLQRFLSNQDKSPKCGLRAFANFSTGETFSKFKGIRPCQSSGSLVPPKKQVVGCPQQCEFATNCLQIHFGIRSEIKLHCQRPSPQREVNVHFPAPHKIFAKSVLCQNPQ